MACKPGSVLAVKAMDGHSSGMAVASHLEQPTRTRRTKPSLRGVPLPCSYLVLLPVGFTLPILLPASRCALTAPFHPCHADMAVCFLWHFP